MNTTGNEMVNQMYIITIRKFDYKTLPVNMAKVLVTK